MHKAKKPPQEPNFRTYLGLSHECQGLPYLCDVQKRISKLQTAISDAQKEVNRVELEVEYDESVDCDECGCVVNISGKIEVDCAADAQKAADDADWEASLLDELHELMNIATDIEAERDALLEMVIDRLTDEERNELEEEIIQHRLKHGKRS